MDAGNTLRTVTPPTGNTCCDEGFLDKHYVWIGVATFVIVLLFPSLFFITLLGFTLGFCSLGFVQQRLQPFILGHLKRKVSEDRNYDPLLHPGDQSSVPGCRICNVSNCSRDSHQAHRRPSHHLIQDLRIDPRLDAAVARFFTAVFAVYVSPDWAPYETRLELKRVLVKTLLSFGQGVKDTFFSNNEDSIVFVRQKVLPLFLFHINSIRQGTTMSPDEEKKAYQKAMALTKILLAKYVSPEDAKCKLWAELVLSVLGSGVFWNLIELGRRELPILLKELYEEYLSNRTPQPQPLHDNQLLSDDFFSSVSHEEVSLLFDSFLDPVHDIEQPSAIFSRCRPTITYVLKESDLLYCLIQFLKGEGGLEWLQILLEQEPGHTGYNTSPRKVIEIKHLSHFARSRIFLENLGFSRVEHALEVGPELYSNTSIKPSSNHTRSSSYGGGSSGGIFEKNVIEGVAIYPPLMNNSSIRTSITGGSNASLSPPSTEPDSLFRRRDTLEPFIAKFYASLYQQDEAEGPGEPIPPLKKRVGTEPKSITTNSTFKRVLISDYPKSIADTLSSTLISLMRKNSPWKGVCSGWIALLHPLLNEKFTQVLDEYIVKALALDNILFLINLITDAFIESEDPIAKEKKSETQQRGSRPRGETRPPPQKVNFTASDFFSIDHLLESLFDTKELLDTLSSYPDGILLFFVDLLDLLVATLTTSQGH